VPLLIFPLIFIGFTSYISARSGITKVAKNFLSYKVTEMYKFCKRQVEILKDTGLEIDETYVKLAKNIEQRTALILDPMLATGGTLLATIDLLKKAGCKKILFSLLATTLAGFQAIRVFCAGRRWGSRWF
jgi:uracil phosphoribosyltransferase